MRVIYAKLASMIRRNCVNLNSIARQVFVGYQTIEEAMEIYNLTLADINYIGQMVKELNTATSYINQNIKGEQ